MNCQKPIAPTENTAAPVNKNSKQNMIYKAVIFFSFLLILLAGAAFLGPEKNYEFRNPAIPSAAIQQHNNISPRLSDANQKQQEKNQEQKSDFSFLLLGKVGPGQGGQWHNASDLADVIMIVYCQPSKKTVNLISLPRDLYGAFGDQSFKINELLWRNKIDQVLEKLPEVTGITTDNFIIIDLNLVKNFVDEIGGIDINLPSDVIDSVSGYALKAGQHHLNGDDAAWILRNRFSKEGDFFREKNQHLIVKSIYNRYKNLDSIEKMKLFINLGTYVKWIKTNINFSELLSLSRDMNDIKIQGITLNFSTGLLMSSSTPVGSSTAYILVPKAGINNYEEIKNFITSKL